MKPAIRKAGRTKTMQVSTFFTGAVACATAFAPAATAATSHRLRPDGKTTTATGLHDTISGVRPDTSPGYCPDVPKWVHLQTEGGGLECFGYDGTYALHGAFVSVCGGNNSGFLYTTNGESTHFGPGDTFVHLPWHPWGSLMTISITNSQPPGNHACV
jgi:hypothetical protein